MKASTEALKRLKEGNKRFVSGLRSIDAMVTSHRRAELAKNGQKPFAIVLSCADSRVPAEQIFDVGLGDLFVCRVAGNIVAPSLIGSIEFAATSFGTPLVVVMGHSACGAVQASLNSVLTDTRPESDNVNNIVIEITPAIRNTLSVLKNHQHPELLDHAIDSNVDNSIEALYSRSRVLRSLTEAGKLDIVGAYYDMRSGEVRFHDSTAVDVHRHSRATLPLSAPSHTN